MSHIVIADWTPILITTDHDPNIFAGVYRVLAVIVESTLSLVTLMYHISQDSVLWLVLVNVYSQLLMFSRGTRNIWTKEMKTTDLISSPITAMWQPVQFFSSKHSSLWKLYCLDNQVCSGLTFHFTTLHITIVFKRFYINLNLKSKMNKLLI